MKKSWIFYLMSSSTCALPMGMFFFCEITKNQQRRESHYRLIIHVVVGKKILRHVIFMITQSNSPKVYDFEFVIQS